jgi:hypothetical protein
MKVLAHGRSKEVLFPIHIKMAKLFLIKIGKRT